MLGLGWAQWLTIFALVGGLILTFKVMARASIAYDKARRRREQASATAAEEQQPEGEDR